MDQLNKSREENQALTEAVQHLDQRLVSSSPGHAAAPAVGRSNVASDAEWSSVLEEKRALEVENAALKEELAAFDLSFFDEIDDLKFRYSESVKLLAEYEARLAQMESNARVLPHVQPQADSTTV